MRIPRPRIDYPRAQHTGLRKLVPSWRQVLTLVLLGFAVLAVTSVQLYRSADVSAVVPPQATTIYFSDGKTEIGRFGENRTLVSLGEVPQSLQDAVLAAEDRDFYSHDGFSVTGITRAAWKEATGGSRQGGSTITQQYAKNAYLTQERTFERKLKELVLSVKLDKTRTKEQILEDYLNTIYFGRGAYGVEAASQVYFGRSVRDINLSQSAMLASILRSPERLYNPAEAEGLQNLEDRWAFVLNAMVEEGWLPPAERDGVKFPKIRDKKPFASLAGPNGYLVDMVKQELSQIGFDEERLQQGGLDIVTTFDKDMQADAIAAVEEQMPTTNAKGVRVGLVSIDARSGGVLAIYGGDDFTKQYNAATIGRPQAGSTFKAFGLVAATRDGVSLADRFTGNSPEVFELPDGTEYPSDGSDIENFGGSSYGSSVSLLTATEKSINTAYVDVNLQVGPEELIDVAERAGLPEDTPQLQQAQGNNVLGFASPRIIDMATAYATFANEGVRMDRHVIGEVRGTNGGILKRIRPEPDRRLPADAVREANYALQQVVQRGTATGAKAVGRPVAGKTGTTSDNKAAWFVGYTPQVATAVALYRESPKGAPLSLNGLGGNYDVTGGSFPLSIWTAFMQDAMEGYEVEEFSSAPSGYSVPSQAPVRSRTPSRSAEADATDEPAEPLPSTAPPVQTTAAPPPDPSITPSGGGTPTGTDEP
jgi:membrane peptidoglycan carboxypeptidase